jgi:hypothetical protein
MDPDMGSGSIYTMNKNWKGSKPDWKKETEEQISLVASSLLAASSRYFWPPVAAPLPVADGGSHGRAPPAERYVPTRGRRASRVAPGSMNPARARRLLSFRMGTWRSSRTTGTREQGSRDRIGACQRGSWARAPLPAASSLFGRRGTALHDLDRRRRCGGGEGRLETEGRHTREELGRGLIPRVRRLLAR